MGPRSIIAVVLAPLAVLVTLAAWAVATPVGSTPDEDYHVVSIWCADGDRAGVCESPDRSDGGAVPFAVAEVNCFIGDPDASARCQDPDLGVPGDGLKFTERGNFAGVYPPLFYDVLNQFVGPDVRTSVVTMRVAAGAAVVLGATALLLALPRVRRTPYVIVLAVSATPLVIFLVASINPSGWSAFTPAAVYLGLAGFYGALGRWRFALLGIALLAAAAGAGSRADTAAYVGVAAACATLIAWRPVRRRLVDLLGLIAVGAVAAYFFLGSGQSGALDVGSGAPGQVLALGAGTLPAAATTPGPGVLLWDNFLRVPELWAGMFGAGRLGELGSFDTELPAIVWVFGGTVFAAALVGGIRERSIRKLVALGGIVALAWLLPMILLYAKRTVVGSEVQPRYIMPLLVLLVAVALWQTDGRPLVVSRGQALLGVLALTAVNSVALHSTIRRYVTGQDVIGFDLDVNPDWWQAGASPMTVWLIGSLAYAVFLGLAGWYVSRPAVAATALPARPAARAVAP